MRLKAGDALGAMAAGRPAASEYSVSRAVQYLKGKSSHKPLTEHQKAILGQHLWSRGCWVASSGNVTDEYGRSTSKIKNQKNRMTISR
jgi:putative transposase